MENRTKNAVLNIVTRYATTLSSLLISFLNRVVFLKVLDATYLGVSGLFSNITLVFSLVELGMGAALTQMFYKPFAEKDYQQLSRVTNTTRVLLNAVGIVIIVLTIVFTPFLQFFVNDIHAVPNMRLIFFLYGTSSSVTYFFGYFRTIITANQQAYKLVKVDVIWHCVAFGVQALILVVTQNFIAYLITQILLNILLNIIIMVYVKGEIPEIDYRCREFIPKQESRSFFKNVVGLSMNKLASVVTNGTDNILISRFLNLTIVGLASNYVMVQQAVNGLVEAVFTPLLASIGNLCVSENKEIKYQYFKRFTFAAFWIYGFCSITAFVLSDIFIKCIFGVQYVIPLSATFFLFLDFFCLGLYRVATLFRTAEGLFWHGKFRALIQALLNLVISLILVVTTHELWAVYAGTVASRVFITIWYEPYIVMKYSMKKTSREYYTRLATYIIAYFVSIFVTKKVIAMLSFEGIAQLIVAMFLCCIVINILFVLLFFRTNEFKYWFQFVKDHAEKIRKAGKK